MVVPVDAFEHLTAITADDHLRKAVRATVHPLFTAEADLHIPAAYQFLLHSFNGVYRQDVYEIPPDVIRELIVNAVVHRSYLDHGNIQVALYDNRLEITSPGKLPMGQTLERMKEGYSKIRNEALAYAFAYMNLIEHWGSGIPRIMGKVKAYGLREPEFIGGEVDLRINIYRNQLSTASAAQDIPQHNVSADNVPTNNEQCRESADNVPITCRQMNRSGKFTIMSSKIHPSQLPKPLLC